ncbi:hypothetical protein ACWEF9_18390 [Streptomyces sp. NPDC004980]
MNDSVDLSKSIAQVELLHANRRHYSPRPHSLCGNAGNTITVQIFTHAGSYANDDFTVAVL